MGISDHIIHNHYNKLSFVATLEIRSILSFSRLRTVPSLKSTPLCHISLHPPLLSLLLYALVRGGVGQSRLEEAPRLLLLLVLVRIFVLGSC